MNTQTIFDCIPYSKIKELKRDQESLEKAGFAVYYDWRAMIYGELDSIECSRLRDENKALKTNLQALIALCREYLHDTCTCAEAWTSRRLVDPNCLYHDGHDEIFEAIKAMENVV